MIVKVLGLDAYDVLATVEYLQVADLSVVNDMVVCLVFGGNEETGSPLPGTGGVGGTGGDCVVADTDND